VGIGVDQCNHSGDAKGAPDVIIDQKIPNVPHDDRGNKLNASTRCPHGYVITHHQVIPLVGRKNKKYMDAFMVL